MTVYTASLEQNIETFPRYKAATSVSPWMPVFFFFFIEHVSLSEAILLGSAFYFAAFLLEVPSGYLADRYGRRPTLILAAFLTVIACALFIVADSFSTLFFAQVLMASGMAFRSGSDSALLYDSLSTLGRAQEYSTRESAAQKWSMMALAVSCLAGGALAIIDIRLVYAASLLAAVVSLILSIRFVEPSVEGAELTNGFIAQMRTTIAYFSHPLLCWILVFFIIGFSLEHVPFEFYQPYLTLLSQNGFINWLADGSAPLVSAVVISISMFGGAIGAAASDYLIKRIGLRTLLITSIAVQLLIILGMSLMLHPIIMMLIMFRNFSMSMARGPMLGAIAPHVSSAQRATFLSLMSLCGRAAFSSMLAILSLLVVGPDVLDWATLSAVLVASLVFGTVALLLLFFWSRLIASKFSPEGQAVST